MRDMQTVQLCIISVLFSGALVRRVGPPNPTLPQANNTHSHQSPARRHQPARRNRGGEDGESAQCPSLVVSASTAFSASSSFSQRSQSFLGPSRPVTLLRQRLS